MDKDDGGPLRTDFEALEDGTRIVLHPNAMNPLHKRPVSAIYQSGYFYCDGSNPIDGPDYYFRDVAQYNEGFSVARTQTKDSPDGDR